MVMNIKATIYRYEFSFTMLLSLFSFSTFSNDSIGKLILKETGEKVQIVKLNKTKDVKYKKIKFTKNKHGRFDITWKVLSEYNVKTKMPSENLKQVLNQDISIKGFMIPLDYSAKKIKEFLLVPYIPSCLHVPPPPGNMIINVKIDTSKNFKPSYYPIEVSGILKLLKETNKSEPYMDSGIYTITTKLIKELEE